MLCPPTMYGSNEFISYIEPEDIEIKPSSELIADEYEHSSNENILVHIFFATGVPGSYDNAKNVYDTLTTVGYLIGEENIHKLDEDFSKILDILDNVSKQANDKDGLILFFAGMTEDNASKLFFQNKDTAIEISTVWQTFTSQKCPGLKNKPKIFIFQVSNVSRLQHDHPDDTTHYDTPAEADMLIVYNKTDAVADHDATTFTRHVCENIGYYGKSEDAISLVTCTDNLDKPRPLIISTLTRKFYFTTSELRGDHHYISERQCELSELVGALREALKSAQAPPKKKRFSSFRNKLSFGLDRKKKDECTEEEGDGSKPAEEVPKEKTTAPKGKADQAEGAVKRRELGPRKISKDEARKSSTSDRPPWRF